MSGLILLPLLGALFYLMVMPQRRQAKAQRELLAALQEGDAIITTAGIYGIVTELDDDIMYVEVAEGIELKMSRGVVARRILDEDAADESTGAPAEGK